MWHVDNIPICVGSTHIFSLNIKENLRLYALQKGFSHIRVFSMANQSICTEKRVDDKWANFTSDWTNFNIFRIYFSNSAKILQLSGDSDKCFIHLRSTYKAFRDQIKSKICISRQMRVPPFNLTHQKSFNRCTRCRCWV